MHISYKAVSHSESSKLVILKQCLVVCYSLPSAIFKMVVVTLGH